MRRTLLAIGVLALVFAPQALGATRNVDITRLGFSPNRVVIDPGDTVVWTNKDSGPHQVVDDQGRFPASPVLQPNQTYSYVFTKSGTFGYRDPFNRNERGTVVVNEGVAIAAAARLVAFGGSTVLSGTVSNAAAGQRVSVFAQECGKTTSTRITTVTTGANGAWTFTVKPALKTVYTARWKTKTSTAVEVSVAPRVTLARLGRRRYSARVSAAQSLVGKYVVLQRFSASRRRWLTVRKVVLRTQVAPPPTAVAAATFSSRLRRGTRLRLVMPAAQVGPCYSPAASNVVRA